MPQGFVVKLDEDAKAEKELEDNNLIIIGGPGTNIVSSEFNRYLPIKFNEENFWSGLVDKPGELTIKTIWGLSQNLEIHSTTKNQ